MLKAIVVALLVVVLVMLGTASKLQNPRNIQIQGAVSGNANFDGDKDITINTKQSNIAILTGNITTPAAGNNALNATAKLAYPSGFNKNNCVIISLMSRNTAIAERGYCTVGATGTSGEMQKGNYGLQAQLTDSEISVQVYKINANEASKSISIRVVLMRIS